MPLEKQHLGAYAKVRNHLEKTYGLKQVHAANPRVTAFRGQVDVEGTDFEIEILISDWDFNEFPQVRLIGAREKFPKFAPHFGMSSRLCYLTRGETILNPFSAGNAIELCMQSVISTLASLLHDPDWVNFETQREFESYWQEYVVLSTSLDFGKKVASVAFIGANAALASWITQDEVLAQRLHHANSLEKLITAKSVWLYSIRSNVSLGSTGPPRTIGEFLRWLGGVSPQTRSQVVSTLGTSVFVRAGRAYLVFETPSIRFGVSFELPQVERVRHDDRNPKRAARAARSLPHALFGRLRNLPIDRFVVKDASPAFVHSRNTSASLASKRILLIGCGAVGGYLAGSLCRLGAGTGIGGELILCDFDSLWPENIGRHYLGYEYIGQSKSAALVKQLGREMPQSKIVPMEVDVLTLSNHFAYDLVIDATGEEGVSRKLNRLHQAALRDGESTCPMLFVWVEGAGEGVQALWSDGHEHACFECLYEHLSDGGLKRRLSTLKSIPELIRRGCQTYLPFAVGAAMGAAALATDMVSSWSIGDVRPRFRSRSREGAITHPVKSHNESRQASCPACSKNA